MRAEGTARWSMARTTQGCDKQPFYAMVLGNKAEIGFSFLVMVSLSGNSDHLQILEEGIRQSSATFNCSIFFTLERCFLSDKPGSTALEGCAMGFVVTVAWEA